jgi:Domain of unknown function (DUF4270)
VFLAVLLALTACEAPKEIGLPPEASVNVSYTDTVTVRLSSVLLDSVRTSNTLRLLVGNYQDPTLGRVSARTYFSPTNGWTFDETKTYEYDSVALVMSYSYVYGDTLKPFELAVHRLIDSVDANKTYYNINSLGFERQPLTTHRFEPTPFTNTALNIRLPDAFGREIFDAAKNKKLDNATAILKILKGFALVPNPENAAVLGFVPNTVGFKVYLHEVGQTTALVRDFVTGGRRFNQVSVNRTGTVFAQMQPLKPLSTTQMRGLAYLQDATGLVMKVEFPYLSKILNGPDKVAINRAELTIVPNEPVTGVGVLQPQPTGLVMAETDETSRILRTSESDLELLFPEDGYTFQSFVYPQVVGYDTKFKKYNFVMTTYLQALITGFKKNKAFLLMPINSGDWSGVTSNGSLPSRFNPFLNNGITPMQLTPSRDNIKLQLFYTVIK